MVVLLVLAEVLGELVDARREESHLDLWRAGVSLVLGELPDDVCLGFLRERHDAGQASTGSLNGRAPFLADLKSARRFGQ